MYTTTKDVLYFLGKDAYTRVRGEALGTGDGVSSRWTSSQLNLIDGTVSVYADGTKLTSSYSVNLDDGEITYTASTGSVITIDYDYSQDVKDSVLSAMISGSDRAVEEVTNRVFSLNTGAVEYLDCVPEQSVFYLKNYPIVTLSSVQVNKNSNYSQPDWTTSTQGIGYDYIASEKDLALGRIRFLQNGPIAQADAIKVTYDYGYTQTPALVKELSTLMTVRQLMNSSINKAVVKGQDGFNPTNISEINARIEELVRILRANSISSL
jgi:hypothetical protein